MEQVVRNKLLNQIVRREAHIVDIICRGKFHEHLFIAGHGRILDRDTGFIFKLTQQLGIDIVAPVEYVQGYFALAAAAGKERERERKGKRHADDFLPDFHVYFLLV